MTFLRNVCNNLRNNTLHHSEDRTLIVSFVSMHDMRQQADSVTLSQRASNKSMKIKPTESNTPSMDLISAPSTVRDIRNQTRVNTA
jgi:hypothetical protein